MDRGLLNKATAATNDPTPGYMLNEVSKLSLISHDVCSQLEEYLLNRLKRDDPNVKAKTIKVIRFISEKGNPEFRRSIKRRCERIRACQSFSGPSHPVLGDAPNKLVREEASKCLKILFAEEEVIPVRDVSSRIQGFGNTPINSSGFQSSNDGLYTTGGPNNLDKFGAGNLYTSNVSSNKMMGFGSPQESNFSGSKSEQALKYLSDTANKYIPVVRHKIEQGLSMLNIETGGSKVKSYPPSNSSPYVIPEFDAKNHTNITDMYGYKGTPSLGGESFNYSIPKQKQDLDLTQTYEFKVVADLLAPGGTKVAPSNAVLSEFLKRCCTLDIKYVCASLFYNYRDKNINHHSKLRILLILEALLASKDIKDCGKFEQLVDFIKEKYIVDLYSDKGIVNYRSKITDILVLLGLEMRLQKEAVGSITGQKGRISDNDDGDDDNRPKDTGLSKDYLMDETDTFRGQKETKYSLKNPKNDEKKTPDFFFDDNAISSDFEGGLDLFNSLKVKPPSINDSIASRSGDISIPHTGNVSNNIDILNLLDLSSPDKEQSPLSLNINSIDFSSKTEAKLIDIDPPSLSNFFQPSKTHVISGNTPHDFNFENEGLVGTGNVGKTFDYFGSKVSTSEDSFNVSSTGWSNHDESLFDDFNKMHEGFSTNNLPKKGNVNNSTANSVDLLFRDFMLHPKNNSQLTPFPVSQPSSFSSLDIPSFNLQQLSSASKSSIYNDTFHSGSAQNNTKIPFGSGNYNSHSKEPSTTLLHGHVDATKTDNKIDAFDFVADELRSIK